MWEKGSLAMKFIRHLSLFICGSFLVIACSDPGGDTQPGTDTQVSDTGPTDEPGLDNTDAGGSGSPDGDIDIHDNSGITCDGSADVMREGVVGRSILCKFDHHEGNTTAGAKSGDGDEQSDDEGDDGAQVVYQFDPAAWDLDALADSLASAATDETGEVLTLDTLSDFVYEQGLEEGVNDSEDVLRELSDAFALDIIESTHDCVSVYLQHFEVKLDCLDQVTTVLDCGEAIPAVIDESDPCVDHNTTVADWVKSYLTAIGVTVGDDERELYESILADESFSTSILEGKIRVADLRFYQYDYTKRDWDTLNEQGSLESHESFLNPNNWAKYPLIPETTESDCAGEDIPRCCEYETFINTYDSDPMELLSVVNSCTNELEDLGPYDNSQLYKTFLQHDGSVGGDGAFTIDEFFRPFVLHYEKTTAPQDRGVCYWTALREFAQRTVSVDAGNASIEMNAYDMDTYLQSYNTMLADYDNAEPVASPGNTCEAPED